MIILSAKLWVIEPDPGMLFWTTLLFLTLWFVLGRFAFKPIAKALKDRENSIDDALKSAEKARQEMANLNAKNEELLKQAQEERSKILREAQETKDKIVKDAKGKAKEEAAKIITNAKLEIENQKQAALTEVKNQVGLMALDIAEKVIRKELKGNADQENFVNTLVQDIQLN